MMARIVFVIVVAGYAGAACGQPIATRQPDSPTERRKDITREPDTPFLDYAWKGLSKLGTPTGGSEASAAESKQTTKSDTTPYVWVRLSKDFLATHAEHKVDREKPARDRLLGITFVGTSRTTGQTRLVLHPSEDRASAEIVFEGKIQSRTTGRKGPATLYYRSNSTFRGSKQLLITDSGLKTMPANAEAPTRLTPTQIRTNMPGLRGRLAQRIAWRRVAQSRSQADRIASERRAADIRNGLDQRLNEMAASIQSVVQTELAEMQLGDEQNPDTIRSRSTPEFVEIALVPGNDNPTKFQMPEFEVAADIDVAVRVHRNVIARMITDAQLREKLAVLAASTLQSQMIEQEETDAGSNQQSIDMNR